MDIKLLDVKEAVSNMITGMTWAFAEGKELRDCIEDLVKEVQRNAIEVAVQRCSEQADADVYFHGWLAEESMKSGEPFEEGEDYEVYVINSSILDCKQKLFEENNLI